MADCGAGCHDDKLKTQVTGCDFVLLFPPELSNTLFTYVSDRDLFACCGSSVLWRDVLNNDQQWSKRCLKRGWTKKSTLNEPPMWEDLTHVSSGNISSFRPSPKFSLADEYPLLFATSRLNPLCDWAIYFRKRLHVHKNWSQGVYFVHKLVAPEAETESLIINSSSFNGKYLACGTTLGFVFIWNVSGIPELAMSLNPVKRRTEIEKVFQEIEKSAIKQEQPFQLIYQTKIYFNYFSDEDEALTFQLETFSKRNVASLLNDCSNYENKNVIEMNMWNELFISYYDKLDSDESGDNITFEDVIMLANEDFVYLTTQNSRCYIIWDLHNGMKKYVQLLPASYHIFQMVLSSSLAILSVQQTIDCNYYVPPQDVRMSYGIVIFDYDPVCPRQGVVADTKLEFISPKIIDEMSVDHERKRLAILSQEGVVAAYHILKKELLFLNVTTVCVDNLTISEDMIFYHNCENRTIIGISWSGDNCYALTDRLVGPVKIMCCFRPYLISGGSVRELIVWDRISSKKLHRVQHQPSYITVGRDDPPAMIGYL